MSLPELHLAGWRRTKDTLRLYGQIRKIRLASTAPRNHWWNVPLYVNIRGLTTRRLHHHGTTFEITIDFIEHAVVVRTADGRTRSFGLGGGVPVADFDARVHAILGELGIDVTIREEPFGVPMTTPFTQDVTHASWDREAISRFGQVLDWSDSVFEEFSGWFNGKISPVHLFWHSLDLAVTRFSGRQAPRWPLTGSPRRPTPTRSSRSDSGPVTTPSATRPTTPTPPPEPAGLRDQPLRGWHLDRCFGLRGPAGGPALCEQLPPPATPDHPARRCPRAPQGRRAPGRLGHQQLRLRLVPGPSQLQHLRASAAADLGRARSGGAWRCPAARPGDDGDPAAIDGQDRAVHEAGRVASQVGDGVGDLLWQAGPTGQGQPRRAGPAPHPWPRCLRCGWGPGSPR